MQTRLGASGICGTTIFIAIETCERTMGIRFKCPNGHSLNIKSHLAGKKGKCPKCGAKVLIPDVSQESTQLASAQMKETAAPPPSDMRTESGETVGETLSGVAIMTGEQEHDLPASPSFGEFQIETVKVDGLSKRGSETLLRKRHKRSQQTSILIGLGACTILLLIALIWVLVK